MCKRPLSINSRSKVAYLDECQQKDEKDEGEGVSSKSVQRKLTTINKAMQSLEALYRKQGV